MPKKYYNPDMDFGLLPLGFYVDDMHFNIKFPPDSQPITVEDHIYKTRIEFPMNNLSAPLVPPNSVQSPIPSTEDEDYVQDFYAFKKELSDNKIELQKKFPKKEMPNLSDEKEWCKFCLGSKICKKIYGVNVSIPNETVEDGEEPLLSIMLHFSEKELETLLHYHLSWLKQGITYVRLCHWLFSLLVILAEPLADETIVELRELRDVCTGLSKRAGRKFAAFRLLLTLMDHF